MSLINGLKLEGLISILLQLRDEGRFQIVRRVKWIHEFKLQKVCQLKKKTKNGIYYFLEI